MLLRVLHGYSNIWDKLISRDQGDIAGSRSFSDFHFIIIWYFYRITIQRPFLSCNSNGASNVVNFVDNVYYFISNDFNFRLQLSI